MLPTNGWTYLKFASTDQDQNRMGPRGNKCSGVSADSGVYPRFFLRDLFRRSERITVRSSRRGQARIAPNQSQSYRLSHPESLTSDTPANARSTIRGPTSIEIHLRSFPVRSFRFKKPALTSAGHSNRVCQVISGSSSSDWDTSTG